MILEVKNLNVSYAEAKVLNGVNIGVKEGSTVGLVGPNGAGKSTLLNAIVGLHRPESGTIHFAGQDIVGLPPERIFRLGITLVPEGRRLFTKMNVLDNLQMGANFQTKTDTVEALKMVYRLFPILEQRKDQRSSTLSGGESQMLAIGRALMSQYRLLLLDEMSLGLAPLITREVYEVLRKVREISNATILLVEQQVTLLMNFCDGIYIMEGGEIVLRGEPCELRGNEHVRKAYLGA